MLEQDHDEETSGEPPAPNTNEEDHQHAGPRRSDHVARPPPGVRFLTTYGERFIGTFSFREIEECPSRCLLRSRTSEGGGGGDNRKPRFARLVTVFYSRASGKPLFALEEWLQLVEQPQRG